MSSFLPFLPSCLLPFPFQFIGNLLNDEIFSVVCYFSVMTFNICFKCVLILVLLFFRSPPPIDHGSVAPFGDRDRDRRHWTR